MVRHKSIKKSSKLTYSVLNYSRCVVCLLCTNGTQWPEDTAHAAACILLAHSRRKILKFLEVVHSVSI